MELFFSPNVCYMIHDMIETHHNKTLLSPLYEIKLQYSINPAEFARDVSKRFACSSGIEDNPPMREALKKGRVEVEFQGHLLEELQALLTGNEKLSSHGGVKNSSYCIPKGVIEVKLKKGVPKRKK